MRNIINLSIVLVIFLSSFSVGESQVLSTSKNTISWNYTFYQGQKNGGGEVLSQGIVIGYSRYFTKRIYADISYGMMHFEGRNSSFFLDDDEIDFINMRTYSIGAGYDLFQSDKFILSGELAYLRQTNEQLLSEYGSPEGGTYVRETGLAKDATLRLTIKSKIYITDHLHVIPSYSRGLGLGKYKSDWLSIGLGYSF
ncbi:hypothetical protein LV84_02820 [Algoriphagus ratkowskyi]|uniref:Outer membrane protein with beta-barrel domain n=1 Tax=Algoriphagus ratkowskyi TaxID=57028 RepID=A0A2W7RGI3_9BACT|nr:hypothetical protein [Algoriphagus ratkowskyi]PZX54667.1 hypothetical protein LV84_02820 [Algoriphagus ratkowskyi]TXD76979.1 hypothetical protein ESW18_14320 [Algoriphagus ratkowskyi]